MDKVKGPIPAGGLKYGDAASQDWDLNRKPTTGDILEVTAQYQAHHDIRKAAKIAKISVETATAIVTDAMQDNPESFRAGKSLLWKKIAGEFIVAECLRHAARSIKDLSANQAAYTAKIMIDVVESLDKSIAASGDTTSKDEGEIAQERAEVQKQLGTIREAVGEEITLPGQTRAGSDTGEALGADA